ncbi:MAG TPA: VTT domain-containing protein [Minicystis sp.]|nr:VTT domain-containing protein [Minicystis sp.]
MGDALHDALVADTAWALVLYFGGIALAQFFGLSLSPPTLLAVKVAPAWLVALVGAAAAALCSTLDYVWVPRAFHLRVLERARAHRLFDRAQRAANVAPFVTAGVFAGFPLPFIVIRVMLPLSRYPRWRFVLATAIGRFCRLFVTAYVGAWLEIPTRYLVALLVAGLFASGATALYHHRKHANDLAPAAPAPEPPAPPPTSRP